MIQKQAQIKINLPLKLKERIERRAKEYDFTLAGYLKHLMVREIEETRELDFSQETWESIQEAKSGKAKFTKVKDTKLYFEGLRAKLNK